MNSRWIEFWFENSVSFFPIKKIIRYFSRRYFYFRFLSILYYWTMRMHSQNTDVWWVVSSWRSHHVMHANCVVYLQSITTPTALDSNWCWRHLSSHCLLYSSDFTFFTSIVVKSSILSHYLTFNKCFLFVKIFSNLFELWKRLLCFAHENKMLLFSANKRKV